MSLFDPGEFDTCPLCGGLGVVWDEQLGARRVCDCRAELLPPADVNPDAPAGIESRDDEIRLSRQQARVWALVKDGQWWTLRELSDRTGSPEASVSARLRDLRKRKYGEHEVEREHLGNGLYRYRLLVNPDVTMPGE